MRRLAELEPGTLFTLPGLPVAGRLVKADRDSGTSATVEVWRNGERHKRREITDRWGKTRMVRFKASERLEWSVGTVVDVVDADAPPQADLFGEGE
jgi:hypothetical protein